MAGRELVRKLMRELGLVACQPRPWRPSTTEQGAAGPIPDLVNRDFSAEKPGQKMVGDITYIPTWQGWEYLATVIDCATRKVIGWAMGDNYKTPLITAAIEMAARNVDLPADAVFHSDYAGQDPIVVDDGIDRAYLLGAGRQLIDQFQHLDLVWNRAIDAPELHCLEAEYRVAEPAWIHIDGQKMPVLQPQVAKRSFLDDHARVFGRRMPEHAHQVVQIILLFHASLQLFAKYTAPTAWAN